MKQVNCTFGAILEHDIDLVLVQLLSIDEQFARFVGNRVGIATHSLVVDTIEISKTDADLGESDIEVDILSEDKRIRLLIEDKIDAIAMPRQPERYSERGEKYVKNAECDEYRVMLVCPKKYYASDKTAKRYPNYLFYEEIVEYLHKNEQPVFQMYRQMIDEAIIRAKKPPKVTIDENANSFIRKYIDFQKINYPHLDLRTNPNVNGYWAHYATALENTYLHHKITEGRIDFTFNKAAERVNDLQQVAEWLRAHNVYSVRAVVIAKSGALQITVPRLDMKQPFEDADITDVRACFDAISELVKFADIVALTNRIGKNNNIENCC